ncbi:hypothetical protein SH139x_005383 [Planctomycetaceae bacterium SH139]
MNNRSDHFRLAQRHTQANRVTNKDLNPSPRANFLSAQALVTKQARSTIPASTTTCGSRTSLTDLRARFTHLARPIVEPSQSDILPRTESRYRQAA